ncbi:MAG: hypothetical protein LBD11_03845 [Candidatus Peribacteria bacterium]|nr:hypothetical protein [Candidatus Peribacteria bacterium]
MEPGIAYVAPEDLTTTLSHLVDFAMEVNQLYLSGAPYTFNGDITAHKIKSTVLDTKRLLALVDRSKI